MSYSSGATLSNSSRVRTPAMPFPTITSFDFFMGLLQWIQCFEVQGKRHATAGPRGSGRDAGEKRVCAWLFKKNVKFMMLSPVQQGSGLSTRYEAHHYARRCAQDPQCIR